METAGHPRADLVSRRKRSLGMDPNILVIEDVARILRCTVDTARRIPRDQLPAYLGPGRHRLYFRQDLFAYVRRLNQPARDAQLLVQQAAAEVLGWPVDRVRGRSLSREPHESSNTRQKGSDHNRSLRSKW